MKFKSRKVAMYFGMVLILLMMPILPATITASTTSDGNKTKVNADTLERTASYEENARYVLALNENSDINQSLYYGKAVSTLETYVEVKESPDDSSPTVGKLIGYCIADVLEQNGIWTKLRSGNLIGYAQSSLLCFNEEAKAVAMLETTITATTLTDGVIVYSDNTETSEIINSLAVGTQVTPVKFAGDYLVVDLGNQSFGYIIKSNINIDYGFKSGLTIVEEEAKIAKEAAVEAARLKAIEDARIAEEARIQAEKAAKAKEEALRQQIISRTKSGTDFTYNPTMQLSDEDIWLVACIIDWESGWESYEGKLAVANIVLNRLRSSRYPNTVSGVIYAKSQFSGVLDSSGNISSRFAAKLATGPRTDECVKAVLQALSGTNNVSNFTAFISVNSANYAAYSNYMVIGGHCFY